MNASLDQTAMERLFLPQQQTYALELQKFEHTCLSSNSFLLYQAIKPRFAIT